MRERIYWNRDWKFTTNYCEELSEKDYNGELECVCLPHTVAETPFHYFDESIYQMVSGYRKTFVPEESWQNKQVLLTIEAAGHQAEVYLNGNKVTEHFGGYTAFSVDLAPQLIYGEENVLVVKVDSRESINVPPFGNVIDYMTYGGLYREVYLDILDKTCIEDVFVKTRRISSMTYEISAEITCLQLQGDEIRVTLLDGAGAHVCTLGQSWQKVTGIQEWHPETPNLYILRTELVRGGQVIDLLDTRFGFREAVFKKDGFYLNGKKFKLRGLNHHQSYPYVGYAMPESMQKYDAEILKKELGVNAVRTSHYPQSQHFINACDELGLLVFTEIPGWQHIGDDAWKQIAMKNTEEMVLQYRNHPSIILWGVRINESMDDDALYTETNRIAHELDSTRQTSGVRYIRKSHLLEDVYAYNDFSHKGNNAGCLKKKKSTPDRKKGQLISEFNGHMFPTKSFDCEDHTTEHMLRHARVMNAYYKEKDIAGGFGWCMFDYNTHQDFGSGDRICYHGVTDMFRNKKPAGELYYAQQETEPVLEVFSSLEIGEHPGGYVGDVYLATNADTVRVYKNDRFVKEIKTKDTAFKKMPHGPLMIDEFIGDALRTEEGFGRGKAKAVKKVLLAAQKYGMAKLPLSAKLTAAKCMVFYRMKISDAVDLYGKYVGDWGGNATVYRFEAIKNGLIVKTAEKSPMKAKQLKVQCSHTELSEKNTYDVAAVQFRMESEKNNLLPFNQDIITVSTEGPIEIIGPKAVSLRGGMGGTYVKTVGEAGEAKLIVQAEGLEPITIELTIA
ncbi:MAG: glycoside hydrolase family 2 protein [Lachnospiraceae bacterium]|nr:glycoside hydrolase family 2 protein [Lachnospiraceae bacterium]